MSNKQISKDNREYWSNKLSKKFREKRSAVESMHLAEINKNSEKNYPMFLKRLALDKELKELKLAEKDFNDFFSSIDKKLQDKRQKFADATLKAVSKIKQWQDNRSWEYGSSLPDYSDCFEKGTHKHCGMIDKYLEEKCLEETKKAFYQSKKGQEVQMIDDLQEKAEDLLHSDMIGTEVLKQISLIAQKSKIAITIPETTLKQISA